MELSENQVKKFQDIFMKDYGANYTPEEAKEAAQNLINFAEVIVDISMEQERKKELNSNNQTVSDEPIAS